MSAVMPVAGTPALAGGVQANYGGEVDERTWYSATLTLGYAAELFLGDAQAAA